MLQLGRPTKRARHDFLHEESQAVVAGFGFGEDGLALLDKLSAAFATKGNQGAEPLPRREPPIAFRKLYDTRSA